MPSSIHEELDKFHPGANSCPVDGAAQIVLALLVSLCLSFPLQGQTSTLAQTAPSVSQPQSAPATPSTEPTTNNAPPNDAPQEETDRDAGVFVFKKQVEEVVLHATVVDEQRHLVSNLDRNTFSVYEDGVPQAITSFHREDVPVAMGILIDNSGSMREKRDKVNEAVLNLLRQSNPQDEVFLVNFTQDSYLDQDFTSDLNLVEAALHKVSMGGTTALYDAIVASSIHLRSNTRAENKVLLVITDGRDNTSRQTLREARSRLQEEKGPTLYAIGLLNGGMGGQDRVALEDLADSTGGAAYFPVSVDELNAISQAIGKDIRSRYTIGYKSTNASQTSKYRAIQVVAQARGYRQLTVRTRSGYYGSEAVH